MADDPKIKRGAPRSFVYALIPLGFVLLVLVMIWAGDTDGIEGGDEAVVEEPEAE